MGQWKGFRPETRAAIEAPVAVGAEPGREMIVCTCCEGSGRMPLHAQLQQTLDICRELAKAKKQITALDVHAIYRGSPRYGTLGVKVTPTATNNSLAALERLGFVKRVGRDGRRLVFVLEPKKGKR